MQKKMARILKLSVLVLSFALICGISFAQETAAEEGETVAEEQTTKDIIDLVIPVEWGRIREIYKGSKGSEQVIVHIQDAHCNYDAQNNIENILSRLEGRSPSKPCAYNDSGLLS